MALPAHLRLLLRRILRPSMLAEAGLVLTVLVEVVYGLLFFPLRKASDRRLHALSQATLCSLTG